MAISFRDSSRTELRRPSLGLERLRLRRTPVPRPPASSAPTQIDLVSVLVSKFDVSEERALAFLALLQRVKAAAPRPYVLNGVEVQQFHRLLKLAIPSLRRLALRPDVDTSVHDLIDRAMLDQGMSFKHGMTADACSIVVEVRAA